MQSTPATVSTPAEPRTNMNLTEAADYLRLSVRKVEKLVAARAFRVARAGRRLIFTRAELDRYIALLMAQSA